MHFIRNDALLLITLAAKCWNYQALQMRSPHGYILKNYFMCSFETFYRTETLAFKFIFTKWYGIFLAFKFFLLQIDFVMWNVFCIWLHRVTVLLDVSVVICQWMSIQQANIKLVHHPAYLCMYDSTVPLFGKLFTWLTTIDAISVNSAPKSVSREVFHVVERHAGCSPVSSFWHAPRHHILITNHVSRPFSRTFVLFC